MTALTSRHRAIPVRSRFAQRLVQQPARACKQGFPRVRVIETDQEERHVVLPGNAPEAAQVWLGQDIPVPVLLVADLELSKVCPIVHIPAKYDRAETEPVVNHREELLLGDQLASQLPVGIDAGQLHARVILEDFGDVLGCDLYI